MISADECQRFFRIHTAVVVIVFNLLQAFHSFFAENAAAQPVNCISGVNDDSIVIQNIHDLLNESSLRIYWINTQKHVKYTES